MDEYILNNLEIFSKSDGIIKKILRKNVFPFHPFSLHSRSLKHFSDDLEPNKLWTLKILILSTSFSHLGFH